MPKCTEIWSEKVPDLSHLGQNHTSLAERIVCFLLGWVVWGLISFFFHWTNVCTWKNHILKRRNTKTKLKRYLFNSFFDMRCPCRFISHVSKKLYVCPCLVDTLSFLCSKCQNLLHSLRTRLSKYRQSKKISSQICDEHLKWVFLE